MEAASEPRDVAVGRLRISCPDGCRLRPYDVDGPARPLPLAAAAVWGGRQAVTLTYPAPTRDTTGVLWAMCQKTAQLRTLPALAALRWPCPRAAPRARRSRGP